MSTQSTLCEYSEYPGVTEHPIHAAVDTQVRDHCLRSVPQRSACDAILSNMRESNPTVQLSAHDEQRAVPCSFAPSS